MAGNGYHRYIRLIVTVLLGVVFIMLVGLFIIFLAGR